MNEQKTSLKLPQLRGRRKKLAIIAFKYVENHPRVNRIANTFKDCGYDVTVFGLSHEPNVDSSQAAIRFVTFPLRSTVRKVYTNLKLLPYRLAIGSFAAMILIYCKLRKI